ncbi:MAG: hypothetical protein GC191_17615 [Azospirillum sp.]|nr:hypothetical protein [Azospirillum sp.]
MGVELVGCLCPQWEESHGNVVILDRDGMVVAANGPAQGLALAGCPLAGRIEIGARFLTAFQELSGSGQSDPAPLGEQLAQLLEGRIDRFSARCCLKTPSGPCRLQVTAMAHPNVAVGGAVVVFGPDRGQAAKESRQITPLARVLPIIDALPVAILIAHDSTAGMVTGNRRAYELMRRPVGSNLSVRALRSSAAVGLEMLRDGRPIPHEELALFRAASKGEVVNNFQKELRFADGRSTFVLSSAAPLRDETGELCGAIAAALEFSDQAQAAQAARHAASGDDPATQAITRFLTLTSHELRAPLASILGFSELISGRLAEMAGGRSVVEYASYIHDSGRQVLDTLNDIIDLSRIEAGRIKLEIASLDLRHLLQGAIRSVSDCAAERDVALHIEFGQDAGQDPGSDPGPLWADERAVRQILQNLLSNAIKFTPSGGVVTLGAMAGQDGGITLWVADTGLGMAKARIDRLLQPFDQFAGSDLPGSGGSGLGLPLVKALADRHGAGIAIDSRLGAGTKVTLHFPPAAVP